MKTLLQVPVSFLVLLLGKLFSHSLLPTKYHPEPLKPVKFTPCGYNALCMPWTRDSDVEMFLGPE